MHNSWPKKIIWTLTADFVEKNSNDIIQRTPLRTGNMAEVRYQQTVTLNHR